MKHWTRDEIETQVRGRGVLLCTATTQTLPVPAWLAAAAGSLPNTTAGEVLDAAQHNDRNELIRRFIEAVDRPGELIELRVRSRFHGQWNVQHVTLLNLIEHDDVGGMLGTVCAVEDLDEDFDAEREYGHAGAHDSATWMLAHLDSIGRILHCEGKVHEILGRSPDEVVGHLPMEFMHPDAISEVVPVWLALIEGAASTHTTRRCFIHPDGTELWVESNYLNRLGPDGTGDVLMLTHDITQRRGEEAALQQSHEEIQRLANDFRSLADDFRLLADEVPAAVFRCDADGTVTFHNSRWSELLEDTGELTRVQDAIHPDDGAQLDAALRRLGSTGGAERLTLELRAPDGEAVLALTLRSVGDARGPNRSIVGSLDDVTHTVQLRQQAHYDQLTGLLNRQAFESRLEVALIDSLETTLVVFLDLDGFKNVNDNHGHEAGDEVLQVVANRLTAAVRPEDTVSRYGGDEFVVLCCEIGDEAVMQMVARLVRALDDPIHFNGGLWEPAASIGWARAIATDDAAAVVRRADLAMFDEKHRRRADNSTTVEGRTVSDPGGDHATDLRSRLRRN